MFDQRPTNAGFFRQIYVYNESYRANVDLFILTPSLILSRPLANQKFSSEGFRFIKFSS